MTSSARYILGALVALFISAAVPAGADCTYPSTFSTKGKISGTFYDAAGTPTKVKCDVSVERQNDGVSFMSLNWGACPGISTYGGGVFLRAAEAQRILKKGAPQKSCIVSNRYSNDGDPQRMAVTAVSVVKTSNTASPTVLLNEKGTLNFSRSDGVFAGKFSFTYPKP